MITKTELNTATDTEREAAWRELFAHSLAVARIIGKRIGADVFVIEENAKG